MKVELDWGVPGPPEDDDDWLVNPLPAIIVSAVVVVLALWFFH